MPIVLRPWGASDLSGATIIAESALPQTIGSLAPGGYEIGRIAWNPTQMTVTAAPAAPAAFTDGDWSLTAGDASFNINVLALPSNGGSAITALQYRIGGGSPVNLSGTGTGARTITGRTNGVQDSVEIRAVNAVGDGNWSPVKNVTPVPAAAFFTMGATGPYFVDPANVPANTTVIEYRFKIRIPASATLAATTAWNIATQESQGFDVQLAKAGTEDLRVSKVEDGLGATMLGSTVFHTAIPRDTWRECVVIADQVAQTVSGSVDGVPFTTLPFTAVSNGVFQTGREISFLAGTGGAGLVPQGVQFEYLEAYFTTGGTRTLRKRIAGNAATVNADPWKLGGNAT